MIKPQTTKLPPDWGVVKLGKILEEVDKRQRSLDSDDVEKVLSLTKNFGLIPQSKRFDKRVALKDVSNYKVVRRGWIVYNPYVIWEGAVFALRDRDYGLVSPVYLVWKSKDDTDSFYIDYLLRWRPVLSRISQLCAGTVNRRRSLNKRDFKDFEILFPPFLEQQKIVYVLDAIQEVIGVQEKLIEKTKELKRAMMAKLFREGTRGEKLKKTEIGEIPESWEVTTLSNQEYFEIQNGLWASKKPPFVKIKVVRNTNFEDGQLLFNDVAEITAEVKQFRDRDLIVGDILLERSGGGAEQPVGRVAYIRSDLPGFSFSNFTSRIRVVEKEVMVPEFLFRYLDYFYQRGGTFDLQERTTGIRNLRFNDYLQKPIPLPKNEEQKEVAETLRTTDLKIEIEQKKKVLYEELFRAMLNKLMTGEIGVKDIKFIKNDY